MSIIDNANHSVVSYDPKSSRAFTGQRLAKFSWKTGTDKNSPYYNIKRESKCVSVPVITGEEVIGNIEVLIPHVVSFLAGVQDKIMREILDSGNNVVSITNESISIAAITEWLESNDDSGRITKEMVGTWFDSNISDNLAVVLADRLGVSEVPSDADSDKIMRTVAVFKDRISALAGGKTMYEVKVCNSLKSALELAESGDVMKERFIARLDKMILSAGKDMDMLELL